MKKLVIYFGLVIFSLMITTNAFSQNITISDVSHTADASAVLDVYSTSLGMLVPRLASAPSSPATGLLYYDTGANGFSFYDGSTWQFIDIVNPLLKTQARVFQSIPNVTGMGGQLIPNATWTPVIHDAISYDLIGEMFLGNHTIPQQSYFQAMTDGFYQVNARLDFLLADVENQEEILNPIPQGYVSIAIYISNDGGNTYNMYAQGNKLQGVDNNTNGPTYLPNNLAPNVSDIIPLAVGDRVKIYAWQNLGFSQQTGNPIALPLRIQEQNGAGGGNTQVYFSIHKTN